MLKRTLVIATPQSLTLDHNRMVISSKNDQESQTFVPLEDIGFVLVEDPQTYISMPLLSSLANYNAVVVFCDHKKMPQSLLLNLDGNSTQCETYHRQVEASEPLKKNLWKQIVEVKIRNQALLLEKLGMESKAVLYHSKDVKSGDSDNREGVAARIYWNAMYGDEFVRERYGDGPNPMLNYGYSILRSATARALVGAGLLPVFGIFHHNRYNSYPLADDVMEAYRPFVDEIVFNLYANGNTELSIDVKRSLLQVLYADTFIDKINRPLHIALTFTAASLVRCYVGEQRKISLPYYI